VTDSLGFYRRDACPLESDSAVPSGLFRHPPDFVRGLGSGNPPNYLGHDPLGRLMITALLALLIVQAGYDEMRAFRKPFKELPTATFSRAIPLAGSRRAGEI
jgi:hypothetical protein